MQTGWRLERTYLAGAGYPESRLEGLDLCWSDPLEATGHAALWADNGTGKTTITALRFALYQPHSRDFIRGDSDRSLAKLIRSGDVCHVVEQATRVVGRELQQVLLGMVAYWPEGGSQDLDNPSRLQRIFYGWVSYGTAPTIDDLPFRNDQGRPITGQHYVERLRGLIPERGAIRPFKPSDHQNQWRIWLANAGVDLEQVRFQAIMNASEGGVDKVMRFADSDAFVRWLIGTITSASTVEQIGGSIDALRDNAAARPQWSEELGLWDKLAGPLMKLAILHEDVDLKRRALAVAETDGSLVVADANATITMLTARAEAAADKSERHERKRKETAGRLRRAQAHRLRMHLRAAELRAGAARAIADGLAGAKDEASKALEAWRLVAEVIEARETNAILEGLIERRAAAEQATDELRTAERQYRRDLARLITDRRDRAVERLAGAEKERNRSDRMLSTAREAVTQNERDHAAATEKAAAARERIVGDEQIIGDAVRSGLLPDGKEPVAHDAGLRTAFATAENTRRSAAENLVRLVRDAKEAGRQLTKAETAAGVAGNDATTAQRALDVVNARIDGLRGDDRLLRVHAPSTIDPWTERPAITDTLGEAARRADGDAAAVRDAVAEAQRIIDSVGVDGLLPPAALVERITRTCQARDLPAWAGWRWLADTMNPEDAERFAVDRPEIASGVVIARPGLLDAAAEIVDSFDLDTAIWIGAVTDAAAAVTSGEFEGTTGRLMLPRRGTYDKQAAREMVESAEEALTVSTALHSDAVRRASDARDVLAEFSGLWKDHPADPRTALEEAVMTARERQTRFEAEAAATAGRLQELSMEEAEAEEVRDAAQQTMDESAEQRRLLAPVVTAAANLLSARQRLSEAGEEAAGAERRRDGLTAEISKWSKALEVAKGACSEHRRSRDDAAERLRTESLSPLQEGPVPSDGEPVLLARLDAIRSALASAAVDPELNEQVSRCESRLANLNARLDVEPQARARAERLAEGDGARHPVALDRSVREAAEGEARAREAFAKADAQAETAWYDFRRRTADTTDRTSPDIEGFPSAREVTDPEEAELHSRLLDGLAGELLGEQRADEEAAGEAAEVARAARNESKLLDTAVDGLRYLEDQELRGDPADDASRLTERVGRITRRVREAGAERTVAERQQHEAANLVRAHANGPEARRVEDSADPRVADLILRLRSDAQLPSEAERIAGHLEQRATSLRDDLERHEQNVRTCATMLHLQAATAIQRLRAYQNQSRLPDGLGDWSQRRFVIIEHETVPADESVAVDRVARTVHALLAPGTAKTDPSTLLFAAARALVDAPFRVRLLKPHIDLSLDRVDVAELKNFSGGQRVTAGVLLYATMTRVRAGDDTSIGWLWLDNPFGQASADQFVRTMRRAADQLGLQLLFTAAPKDKGALSMFDRTITLARRSRPSSGENVVVTDDGTRELADLVLIQNDVTAVLGG